MRTQQHYSTILAAAALAVLVLTSCTRTPEEKQAAFLESGVQYAAQGDHARAVLQFQNAVRAVPGAAEPYYQMALAQLALGDPRQAFLGASKAVELDPQHAPAHVLRAQVMLQSGDPDLLGRVEESMNLLLRRSPHDSEARFLLAATKVRTGRQADAAEDLRQALTDLPQHLKSSIALAVLHVRERDFAAAEAVLRQAVAQNPQDPAACVALGQLYTLLGKSDLAEAEFRRALQRGPEHGPALLALGSLLRSGGRGDEADSLYERASRLPERKYRPVYAQFLMLEDQFDAAAREFQALLEENPKNRAARTGMVAAYLAAGKTADAQQVLQDALARNAKDIDALLQKSEIDLGSGDHSVAEQGLRQVLALEPSSAQAHYLLSKVHLAQREPLRQRHELGEALRLDPDLFAARLDLAKSLAGGGDARSALDALDEAPAPHKQRLDFVTTRSWILLALNRPEQARQEMARAPAQSDTPEFWLLDATIKLRAGDYPGARAELERVLGHNPEEARAVQALAESYLANNDRAGAIEALRSHAGAHPDSARLRYSLGQWCEWLGEIAAAREAFEKAAALDPSLAAAQLALARLDVAARQYDEARARLKTTLAADERRPDAWVLLGIVEESVGNGGEAGNHYRKALRLDGQNSTALNNLAYLLASSGDALDEALGWAQKAKEIAPNDPSIDDTIGWIYYRKGLYPAAISHLERAAGKLPAATIKYHLAMAHAKQGNLARARGILETALRQDPGLPEAAEARQLLAAAPEQGR